jgi:hypothetical protein
MEFLKADRCSPREYLQYSFQGEREKERTPKTRENKF